MNEFRTMKLSFFKKSIPTIVFLAVFSVVGITVFYQLLQEEEKLLKFSKASRENALHNWDKQNIAKSHINFYRKILNYE